jgi:hypothetical protein
LRPFNLTVLQADLWNRLTLSAGQPGASFGLASLATVNSSGFPEQRTVVLRKVDPATREVCCYTDRRSPKVRQIRSQPRTSWHFYDSSERIQVLLSASARVITEGDLIPPAWEACRPESRRNFQSLLPPGTPLPGPPDEFVSEESFLSDSSQFAIIQATVDRMEWLHLRNQGNHRAVFVWSGTEWESQWLSP